MFDDAMGWVIGLLLALTAAVLALVVWVAWSNSQKPTFELRRDEWFCTKTELRSHLQPMQVGRATVMMPVNRTECVEYRRHAG